MSMRAIILACLEETPGATANQIAKYTIEKMTKEQQVIQADLRPRIYKELRHLRRSQQVHNNQNYWYRLLKSSI